ncbi:MAG TPA: hypothetical protein GX528_04575 [Firmicutes bacterium]|nr:hypothetical protein [Bacillota bacterium]
MTTGTLVVTFLNSHFDQKGYVGKYHFILYRVCDPANIIHTFRGQLASGERKSYTVSGLEPGNYYLVGLQLPDPKPGNIRTHPIMIYAGIETVYDVCYLKNSAADID